MVTSVVGLALLHRVAVSKPVLLERRLLFMEYGDMPLGLRYTTNALYLMPIITGVAEALILGSIPNRYTLIGAFFVLLGLYISEQKKMTEKGARSTE